MSESKRRRMTVGLILIVVGLGLYLLDRMRGIDEGAVLLIIGSAFLVAYLLQKRYPLLIPAGILLGLGTGMSARDTFVDHGDATVLGLGLGFISIFAIARLYEGKSHWWPLIPGGVLVLVGIPGTHRAFSTLFEHWQLILVIVGLVMLIGAFRSGREN